MHPLTLKLPINLGILVTFFALTSCATHKINLPPLFTWPKSETRFASNKVCYAKADLSIRRPDENISGEISLRYLRKQAKSEFSGILSGPLGIRTGRVDVQGAYGIWTSADAVKVDLSKNPAMQNWFKDSWWEEMDFIFGIVSSMNSGKQSALIKADAEHLPVYWELKSRKIICKYENERPKTCHLTDKDLSTRLDFTSVDCRDTL